MKKYSIIDIPLLSFYSKELYRDICFNWKGTGIGYLFLLVIVCWIPQMFFMQHAFNAFIENEAPTIISQVPDIIFTEGAASTQAKQPYLIKDTKTQKTFFVIDTTGTITNLDKADGAIGLLTKNEIIVKKNDVETRTFSFKDIKHFALDQPQIKQWVNWLSKYTILAISPFLLIGFFVSRIISLLIYGLVGLFFSSILKAHFTYETLLRLSVVAMTPSSLIGAIMQISQTPTLNLTGLESTAITLIYLFIGIKFCAEKPTPSA